MQSKQRKPQQKAKKNARSKSKNVKQSTRGAARPRGQRAPAQRNGLGSVQQVRLPAVVGSISRSNMFGWKFGAAAPHDDFPEGGLRINGVLPGSSSTAVLTQDTVLFGLFGAGGVASAMLTPTGTTTTSGSVALFSTTGPLAVFAQFFRRFRFRKLTAETTSMIPTGGSLGANGGATVLGAPVVQISYEKDPFTADSLTGSYTIDSSVQSTNCTRFNAWANDVMSPLVTESKHDGSDTLYYVDVAADAITSTNTAIIRQSCQGGVVATVNAVNTLADLPLAKVLYRFVIDLYGFTNVASGAQPMVRAPKPVSAQRASKLDQGDVKSSVPDADPGELIDLTPKGARLRIQTDPLVPVPLVRSEPPQSVRVSSRK